MKKMISKSFTFEAAHKLTSSKNKKNYNIHGHSFHVEIFIEDESNNLKKSGYILDFETFNEKIIKIKNILDHSFLNDTSGLENPTLENIGLWIWNALIKDLNVCKLIIKRKSCGETFILEE